MPQARRPATPSTSGRKRRPRSSEPRVRAKVWVERGGEVVMSEYRARLLEHVATTGSVASAAEAMRLPYRTAWKKLREMEAAAGAPLLISDSGGPSGGRSRLTPLAEQMVGAFRRLATPFEAQIEDRFADEAQNFDP